MEETLLEYVLNEKIGDELFRVQIKKSVGGNLVGRKDFIKTILRQTTLDEFMPLGLDKHNLPQHDIRVVYTVHPKCFTKPNIIKLYLDLQKDLDNYIRSLR